MNAELAIKTWLPAWFSPPRRIADRISQNTLSELRLEQICSRFERSVGSTQSELEIEDCLEGVETYGDKMRLLEELIKIEIWHLSRGSETPDPSAYFTRFPLAESAVQSAFKSQMVDDYLLLSTLGQGAMGVVYKAKNLTSNQLVAIKKVKKRLSRSSESAARFARLHCWVEIMRKLFKDSTHSRKRSQAQSVCD